MFRKKINFDLDEFRSRPLPSEQEIMSGWTGDLDKPVVSVICNTYNQEMYIEDAIRGFLIQETDFPFEVIINDDASTDRNPEIIKSYAEKYPSIIKPVFQEENQYSQGRKPSVVSFSHTSGEYIALCEGDDFWICPHKLQDQFNTIERESVGLVYCPAVALSGAKTQGLTGQMALNDAHVPLEEVIRGGGSFCPTASVFVDRTALNVLFGEPWFLQAPVGDLYIQAYCSAATGAYFLAKPYCVYRKFANGSWSEKKPSLGQEQDFLTRQLIGVKGLVDSLPCLDRDALTIMSDGVFYHSAIRFLWIDEWGFYKELIEKVSVEYRYRSFGCRIFWSLRDFPVLAKFLAKFFVFR